MLYSDLHSFSWLHLLQLLYILAPFRIWVHNLYLNHGLETLELFELLKIKILKIYMKNYVLKAGGIQRKMEISTWSRNLTSMNHLAQGEKSTRSRIGQPSLRVGFRIFRSKSHSSLTFDDSMSRIAQLSYYLFWVCICESYNISESIFIPWHSSLWGKRDV